MISCLNKYSLSEDKGIELPLANHRGLSLYTDTTDGDMKKEQKYFITDKAEVIGDIFY